MKDAELIERLSNQLLEAEKKIRTLEAVIQGDPLVKSMDMREGELDLRVSHPLIPAIASSMVDLLQSMQAPNYVEMVLNHKTEGEIILTVQRSTGKTPHQLRQEAEQKCSDLESRLAKWEGKPL